MPCEFEVKIAGKKQHVRWELDKAGRIQCYVTYEPLSEDANRELITHIAEALGINKSKVVLVHGVENEKKFFRITDHDIDLEKAMKALGLSKPGQEI